MEIGIREKGKVDILDLLGSLTVGGDSTLKHAVIERLDGDRRPRNELGELYSPAEGWACLPGVRGCRGRF